MVLILIPSGFNSYAAGSSQLTAAEKNSSYGFFVWLSENAETAEEKADAEAAVQILTNTVTSSNSSKVFNDGHILGGSGSITYQDLLDATSFGQENDATSIENLRQAIDFVTLGNTYRAKENLAPLKISSAMMAMAELNANYQDNETLDHSSAFNALENLAYRQIGGTWQYGNVGGGCTDDPYEGWYTKEKKYYDEGKESSAGHYLTMTDRKGVMKITGFGVRDRYVDQYITASDDKDYLCHMHDRYYSQHYSTRSGMYDIGTGVTPEKYHEYLDKYNCEIIGHTWDEGTVDTPATHTTEGVMKYTCTVCGETKTAVIEKTAEHTAGAKVIENETPATCAEGGSYDEVVYCSGCGEEISRVTKTTEPDESTHVWGNWEETKAPTEEEEGEEERICSVCHKVETQKIPQLSHVHVMEPVAAEPATCIETGVIAHWTCNKCGLIFSDEEGTVQLNEEEVIIPIDPNAHTPGETVHENESAATCSAEGSYDEVVKCAACGEEISRETKPIPVDPDAHTPGSPVHENEAAATCEKEGSYDEVVFCAKCGVELSREEKKTEKIAHTPGSPVHENEAAATCEKEGSYDEVVFCTKCGVELSREEKKTEKIAHTPGDPVHENEAAATCKKEGSYDEVVYCTKCGAEISRETKPTSVDPNKHTPGAAVRENEVPATCSAEGSYDEVVKCSACGKELSRETKPIPVDANAHDWGDWVPTKPATETEDGEETRTCKLDPSHTEKRAIPKIVTNNNVADAAISGLAAKTYTGQAITQNPVVKLGNKTLKKDTDYKVAFANNINAGTARVTITGCGDYKGTKAVTFAINPKAINPAVTLNATEFSYSGRVITPAVAQVRDGNTVINASQYTAAPVGARKEIGTYGVTVTMKGNYKGSATAYFTIGPKGTNASKPKGAKKALTVKWKAQKAKMANKKRINGYQIQVSPVRNFASGVKTKNVKGYKKKSVKVKGLAPKTIYYVRVRTYMSVGGRTYFSPWSAVKFGKTK